MYKAILVGTDGSRAGSRAGCSSCTSRSSACRPSSAERSSRLARAEGLDCTRLHVSARHPWRAILETARRRRCDLIVLGAHGGGGMVSELLGGQATRVLARSKIPVLICR